MKGFRKPDLNAPRYRPDRTSLLNADFCNEFRKKFPEYSKISNDEIKEIVTEYNGQLWQGVIDHRDGIELPESLGNIFIGTCNSPKIKYNHNVAESIKQNAFVRLKNYESDGYLAKIFYTNYASKYKFAFREFWEFKGTRDFTREVSKTYPIEWKKYIVVENTLLISKLYKKIKTKIWAKDKPLLISRDYNEFNLD